MTLTAHEAWTRLLDRARQELPEQTYKTWLEPTEALSMTDGVVFVGAPDQFAADWNQSKHADMLASLAPIALGHPLSITFKVTDSFGNTATATVKVNVPINNGGTAVDNGAAAGYTVNSLCP